MRFFTSDTHFNNEESIIRSKRPFKNAREYDKKTIRMWNKQAKKGDTIYVVGDFLDCDNEKDESWKKALGYFKKIKADIVLILGNNEERVIKYFFDDNFEKFAQVLKDCGCKSVYKDLQIEIGGIMFNLVHECVRSKKDMINLFGHVHNICGLYKPCGINVSCDLSHFKLYTENDILYYVEEKKRYWDVDENIQFLK